MSTSMGYWFVGSAVALLALVSCVSALTARGYTFASGRVQGVIGLMGSGKSLFIVQRVILPAAKQMTKKRGLVCGHTGRPVRRIITNFEMELPYDVEHVTLDGSRIWDHLVELVGEYENGRLDALIVIDEAHLFIPSAKMKVAQKAAWVTSMARKLNSEVWWITQNEMKVHKRLRDDTMFVWRVGRGGGIWSIVTGPSKWFTARAFEPENLRRLSQDPVERRFYRLSKQAIAAYDSFELIVPDAEADVSLDALSAARNVLQMPSRKMADGQSLDLPGSLYPSDSDADVTTG